MSKASGSTIIPSDSYASPNHPGRPGQAVIVVDASAILALLLNTAEAPDLGKV